MALNCIAVVGVNDGNDTLHGDISLPVCVHIKPVVIITKSFDLFIILHTH